MGKIENFVETMRDTSIARTTVSHALVHIAVATAHTGSESLAYKNCRVFIEHSKV